MLLNVTSKAEKMEENNVLQQSEKLKNKNNGKKR